MRPTSTAGLADRGERPQVTSSFNNAPMSASGGMSSLPFAAHPLLLSQQAAAVAAAQRARGQPDSAMNAVGPAIAGHVSAQHFLPTSAPVSSLLPPIPSQNAHCNFALQSQLAALINNGSMQSNNSQFSQGGGYGNRGEASVSTKSGSGSMSGAVAPARQNWTLARLEQHVKILENLKQPVPQTVALLLADARRKKQKKEAKRVANRKSACTSRARKKALVQEMTETNARLKRQALILALLPDMVIVIDVEGEITFCSAQVERVLRHKNHDLVGAKLTNLLVPSSRAALPKLVNELVELEKTIPKEVEGRKRTAKRPRDDDQEESGEEKALSGGETSVNPAGLPSEPAFPMSVVKVDAAAAAALDENDSSDASASNGVTGAMKQPSSLTRSPTSSSVGNSGSDDVAKKVISGAVASSKAVPSSDGSNNGSVSTDAKKLQNANENLERNVRFHNKKMKANKRAGYMDDVIGAAVTANNASARLSSLQHLPESSEEDSGYRESNDSREETSSSASDSETSNGRRKPLAPTCNVCLIRDDLTTIWCEVTSSIRTKETPQEPEDLNATTSQSGKGTKEGDTSVKSSSESDSTPPVIKETKELLLCLRPIRDGEGKVDEKFRFMRRKTLAEHIVSESSNTGPSSGGEMSLMSSNGETQTDSRPPKKRRKRDARDGKEPSAKRNTGERQGEFAAPQVDTEKSVVESLMLMNRAK